MSSEPNDNGSEPWALAAKDVRKWMIGCVIAIAPALIVYVGNWTASLDMSTGTGIALSVLGSAIVGLLRKIATDTRDT